MSVHQITHRSLIAISGRDTFKYLQALTTNSLASPKSQYTAFLNAQGRVLYDAFLYRTAEDGCLLEIDGRATEGLLAHLKRYKLRSKFTSRLLDKDEMSIYSIWDHDQLPDTKEGLIVEKDCRSPSFGHRMLAAANSAERIADMGLSEVNVDDYTYRRYQHGIPEGIAEIIPEKALPMESNIDYMHGIDFHKGCYLGQELTVRTHHTGVIRKRILPVRFEQESLVGMPSSWTTGEDAVSIYTGVDHEVKGRPAGRLLARMKDLGLAIVRLEKMGFEQSGRVELDGKQLHFRAYKPKHWPADAEQV